MNKLEVELSVVKNYNANAAVVLAYVNTSDKALSNTEVANGVGISFPTAQKVLQTLANDGLITEVGKLYRKL